MNVFWKKRKHELLAELVGNHNVGPLILPQRLMGEIYSQHLQITLPYLLDDLPLRDMWFVYEGVHIFQ